MTTPACPTQTTTVEQASSITSPRILPFPLVSPLRLHSKKTRSTSCPRSSASSWDPQWNGGQCRVLCSPGHMSRPGNSRRNGPPATTQDHHGRQHWYHWFCHYQVQVLQSNLHSLELASRSRLSESVHGIMESREIKLCQLRQKVAFSVPSAPHGKLLP